MSKLTIRVTQEHIDKGHRNSCGKCPVALAMKDAGLGDPQVGVHGFQYLHSDGFWTTGILPEYVRDFIRHFDGAYSVSPFEFDVEVAQ